ncbi:MAG: transglycosylase SLT domain-containing protein [Anaerolineaceae bacterium]
MNLKRVRNLIAVVLAFSVFSAGCLPTLEPPSPTSTLEQVPTATATSLPAVIEPADEAPDTETRLADADLALLFGDYQTAYAAYQQAANTNSADLQPIGWYGQALIYLKQDDQFHAELLLQSLIATYPDTLPGIRALILQAQIDQDQNQYQEALESYQTYLAKRPGVLDAYVYEQMGNLYVELGQDEQALEAYSQAYLASALGANLAVGQKVASCYERLGQPDLAIQIYQDQYNQTDDLYFKAQMDLLLGRAMLNQGDTEQGYAYFQDAVNNYPEAYDSYSALVALIEANQPVDDLQRGLINYFVGQYDLANDAFERYLAGTGAEKDKALYYQALAVRAAGLEKASFNSEERFTWNSNGGTAEDNTAIGIWASLVEDYPRSSYVVHAIEDIVYTQDAYMDDTALAAKTALDYVAQQPQASYAPSLLFSAGRYYEIEGQLELAAQIWDRIGTDYPSSDESFQGSFFAGILHYRRGDMQKSTMSLNRALLLALEPLEIAGSYLWLGKVSQSLGEEEKAIRYWNSAVQADPSGYYGLRARELLENQPVFASPSQLELTVDLSKAREAAAAWLRTSFNLPPEVNLDYSEELYNDPRFVRGSEFWKLGMYAEARDEFESLRNDQTGDVANTFRLLQVFLDLGLYRSAIEASQTITTLAGYSDTALAPNLPAYFDYIQYGTYYLPWIQATAEDYNVPILLIFSIIHQESRFEGFASSSAGAQGLMQIMPETAAQIAGEINYPPDFSAEDLTVPLYNLTLGTNYLSRQLYAFDGDYYAALAAYNGGPGSARDWKEIAGDDPDLFLGSIRYLESRNYVRKIVEIYAHYARIYRK